MIMRAAMLWYKQLANVVSGRHVPRAQAGSASAAAACRCCDNERLDARGRLPDARVFAGTLLEHALTGGSLYACPHCGFVFRHPICSKQTYDALYRAGKATTWDEAGRVDQELVRSALCTFLQAGTVLDVGCGSGNLLMPLGAAFAKFGVEINAEAARIAEARGVRIVAQDLEQIAPGSEPTPGTPQQFDAVVACDVIEHVANPLAFLRLLLAKTRPGGLVVVSTGNADAWSWRLAGSRFWYCFLPEHISFVSPAWFRHYAAELRSDIVEVKEYVYSAGYSRFGKALRLALMALFRIAPRLYYHLLPAAKRNHIPVGRGITRDHFVIVLRKQPVE